MLKGIGTQLSGWWERNVGGGQEDFSCLQSREVGILDHVAWSSSSRRVVLGTASGALLGAAAGYVTGLTNLVHDTVDVRVQTTAVTRPVLVGALYHPESCTTTITTDSNGNIDGSRTDCTSARTEPLYRQDPTGQTFQNQEMTHSRSLCNPFLNAGVGMVAGGMIGALSTLLYTTLRMSNDWDSEVGRGHNQAPWVGLGAGAALGAGLGLYTGRLAEARQVVVSQNYTSVVTRTEQLGNIPTPSDFPSGQGQEIHFADGQSQGSQPAVAEVPTGQLTQKPTVTRAYGYSAIQGALMGAGIGAATGFAAGVATGLVARGLERR